jgi:tetratricopeptide (TPR) repeat protein
MQPEPEPQPEPEDEEEAAAKARKAQAQREKEAGNAAYKARQFEAAIGHYDKAAELDPSDISFLTNRCGTRGRLRPGQLFLCHDRRPCWPLIDEIADLAPGTAPPSTASCAPRSMRGTSCQPCPHDTCSL